MESKMSNTIKKFRLGELFCGPDFGRMVSC